MPRTAIAEALRAAAERLRARGELAWTSWPDVVIDPPREAAFGDYAANAALLLAREARRSPLAIAQALAAELAGEPVFASVSAAAPGFLNFRFATPWLEAALREALGQGPWRARLPLAARPARHFRLDVSPETGSAGLSAAQARAPRVGASLVALSRLSGHSTTWTLDAPEGARRDLEALGALVPGAELSAATEPPAAGGGLAWRSGDEGAWQTLALRALTFEREGQPVKAAEVPMAAALAARAGAGALGFALLARPGSEGLVLDLARLGRESVEEPGFAVHYAVRRAASLLGVAPEGPDAWRAFAAGLPRQDEERALLLAVAALPDEAVLAAKLLDPARFVRQLERLAEAFHRFASRCRLVGEPSEPLRFRAALTLATARGVEAGLSEALGLEGAGAWDPMTILTEKTTNESPITPGCHLSG